MKGFTITEALVSILIFSIIVVALYLGLATGQRLWFTGDTTTELRQNVLLGIIPLTRELRQSAPAKTSLSAGTSGSSITFKIPNDNNGDGSTVDNAGNIEWSSDISYARDGSNQLIRTQAGASSIISQNISALEFSRPSGEDLILQIDITARKNDAQGILIQDTEQAVIKMRN